MVLWCGLKLAAGCVGSGASWEELWCRPGSATACALHRATCYKLQSGLQRVASCAEVGDA